MSRNLADFAKYMSDEYTVDFTTYAKSVHYTDNRVVEVDVVEMHTTVGTFGLVLAADKLSLVTSPTMRIEGTRRDFKERAYAAEQVLWFVTHVIDEWNGVPSCSVLPLGWRR